MTDLKRYSGILLLRWLHLPSRRSPDPKLDELTALSPQEVLGRNAVFGTDLFEDTLGDRVLSIYEELDAGAGAVRKTLQKYLRKR